MKNARRNEPAGAGLQAIRAGEIENSIIALIPVFQTATHLRFGGAGLESHEGIGKIVADIVMLRGKVVRFGFAFLADEFGLFGILMHVMWNRTHVIEKLRIDGPFFILRPNFLSNQSGAAFSHGLLQGEPMPAGYDIAEPFV